MPTDWKRLAHFSLKSTFHLVATDPGPFGSASVRLKEHSSGSAFSAMIEQDLNKYWSVNLAGAYNNSMSKEKNGMRAYGVKLGIARWF